MILFAVSHPWSGVQQLLNKVTFLTIASESFPHFIISDAVTGAQATRSQSSWGSEQTI
jgi:hypothetical protein